MARKPSTKPRSSKNKPYCAIEPRVQRTLPDAVNADARRAHAIFSVGSKWVNQTVLHYCFFTKGHHAVPAAQATAVRQAFATWKAVGIGLNFQEVKQLSEAEVRIGYSVADGSSAFTAAGRCSKFPSTSQRRSTAGA
jgi:hypothetical protein